MRFDGVFLECRDEGGRVEGRPVSAGPKGYSDFELSGGPELPDLEWIAREAPSPKAHAVPDSTSDDTDAQGKL